jgi:hypothetical protein
VSRRVIGVNILATRFHLPQSTSSIMTFLGNWYCTIWRHILEQLLELSYMTTLMFPSWEFNINFHHKLIAALVLNNFNESFPVKFLCIWQKKIRGCFDFPGSLPRSCLSLSFFLSLSLTFSHNDEVVFKSLENIQKLCNMKDKNWLKFKFFFTVYFN